MNDAQFLSAVTLQQHRRVLYRQVVALPGIRLHLELQAAWIERPGSAAPRHAPWGTPCPGSRPLRKTARCPAHPEGSLEEANIQIITGLHI